MLGLTFDTDSLPVVVDVDVKLTFLIANLLFNSFCILDKKGNFTNMVREILV